MKDIARWFTTILLVIALTVPAVGTNAGESSLLDMRLRLFSRDLVEHNYDRLWIYLDPAYVRIQREIFELQEHPFSGELFDTLFFGGAAMPDDFDNRARSVSEIASVADPWLDGLDPDTMEVFFTVELTDGRTVQFSLFMDTSTLYLYGPYG